MLSGLLFQNNKNLFIVPWCFAIVSYLFKVSFFKEVIGVRVNTAMCPKHIKKLKRNNLENIFKGGMKSSLPNKPLAVLGIQPFIFLSALEKEAKIR